jgi:hypothetical protein
MKLKYRKMLVFITRSTKNGWGFFIAVYTADYICDIGKYDKLAVKLLYECIFIKRFGCLHSTIHGWQRFFAIGINSKLQMDK